MGSVFGENVKVSLFGQSHSVAVGVVIDGLKAGHPIDFDLLGDFLERRAPGRNEYSTQRFEADVPEFLSGITDGKTNGAPVCAVIKNLDAQPAGYKGVAGKPRPGHADYTAHVKYGGQNDASGGGHLSGRLTASLCVAGGICMQILEREGVVIAAHAAGIGGIGDTMFDTIAVDVETLRALRFAEFPTISPDCGRKMREAIENARRDGDSVGGVVECAAVGVPAGLGDPVFGGVENRIACIVFGIPAVRGIEFGNGFASALMRGSVNNDAFFIDGGEVKTRTNNHGGVLGGITSGMPLIFRVAIKPTPSIAQGQDSVDLSVLKDIKLRIDGRHDPCIVPRAVPCIEAATAIALLDMMDK